MNEYYEELNKLVELLSKGEITKAEFTSKKEALLNKYNQSPEDDVVEPESLTQDESIASFIERQHNQNNEYDEIPDEIVIDEMSVLKNEMRELKDKLSIAQSLAGWSLGAAILAVILSLTIPGPVGPMGPQGIQGMEGAQGIQGPAGRSLTCTDVKVVSDLYEGYSSIKYYTTYVSKCY